VTAVCSFCDTDFVGGRVFDNAARLAQEAWACWSVPGSDPKKGQPLVVVTGGEPALQLDQPLVEALHDVGFDIAIETNGTRPLPPGLDWICVSPKACAPLVVVAGNELKLVYPQEQAPPERFENLAFDHFLLQPLDIGGDLTQNGPDRLSNSQRAAQYCLDHPQWRLSLQMHKMIGLP
jgi:7-carboxy-7-deazaguanine synthase